ncbi:keratin, type I cytoskeletal 18-like [Choloepus didactylus]|uniref:keratin, type I cytoskeletal 18-like n=1 Tax=Choloepus didactylus TaxID=27675 RepID=UPI00189D1694|nr:keratin, type I cytoskeletal 18-like [Choloepus didactylus]
MKEVLLGSAVVERKRKKQIRQRKKVGCNVTSTHTSANPTGSSEDEMNIQDCTSLSKRMESLCLHISESLDTRNLGRGCALGQHELHHPFHHLLHQLLIPGLSPVAQPPVPAVQQHDQRVCGCRGSGSQITVSCSSSSQGGWGSRALASGMARGLVGMGSIQGEKETTQALNDCLASYLDQVKSLETENQRLEGKIQEHLEKKGPQVRAWSHYFKIIEELRAQIFEISVDNALSVLQIDNARLAADDFRVMYETELAMRQSVESDFHGLRKVTDDTNVTRLQLEIEIEAFKEELFFMKNSHEEEVKGLQTQIASSGLTMEVDTPKSQDLSKIISDIRIQYDELVQKK